LSAADITGDITFTDIHSAMGVFTEEGDITEAVVAAAVVNLSI
jgi:hypothetical protein